MSPPMAAIRAEIRALDELSETIGDVARACHSVPMIHWSIAAAERIDAERRRLKSLIMCGRGWERAIAHRERLRAGSVIQ